MALREAPTLANITKYHLRKDEHNKIQANIPREHLLSFFPNQISKPTQMKLTLEWLALEEKLGERPSMSGTLAEFRTGFDKLGKIIEEKENTPADPSVHTSELSLMIERDTFLVPTPPF